MKRYNPKEIEKKWQKVWEEKGIYHASDDPAKPKRYVLEYFPYPSGAAMHVGHVRNYTIGDAIARYARMQGQNVLHPMGWDAFGLPAENFAIKNNVSPRIAIDQNTARFKEQLMQMGFSYDWTREIDSTDPKYYRWTQWLFLLLFKRGLAYQQESLQWWCPIDKTVLANEQVEAGKCWRCGSDVEKKALKQWFFKITDYADRLLNDLDDLDWSDAIKTMQRNWIGRSKGAEIDFKIDGSDKVITVFTTRPDTLFGATFMVLAPEHPFIHDVTTAEQKKDVQDYVKATTAKSDIERQNTDREKTGVFTGGYAINPVNNEKIPIWTSDYVLAGYGTGAIMAVPAHDERDYEFATKFKLPIRQVIMPCEEDSTNPPQKGYEEVERPTVIVHLKDKSTGKYALLDWHETLEGITTAIMGGIEDGQTPADAALAEIKEEAAIKDAKIVRELKWITAARYCASHKQQNRKAISHVMLAEIGNLDNQGKISQSEQKNHTLIWVDEKEVMGRLTPDHQKFVWQQLWSETAITGEGELINSDKYDGSSSSMAREQIVADLVKKGHAKERINYKIRDWLISRQRYWGAPIPIIHCPKDGVVAVPDDQLPVVIPEIESFEPSGDGRSPLARVKEFVNTTCPECGGPAERETDTMDGFACSSWYFLRFADPHNDNKAFDKDKAKLWLPVDDYIGGAEHAVMHLLYARFWTKVMYDEGLIDFEEPFKKLRNHGMILAPDGQKMSKSKGNTIEPDSLLEQGYGADSIRLMELFIGPWNQSAAWSVEGLGGTFRFLQRVWTLVQEHLAAKDSDKTSEELKRAIAKATKAVTEDMHELGFNTAIAALMELVNELYKIKTITDIGSKQWRAALTTVVQLLAPFAPHITEELWHELGNKGSVHTNDWPTWDEKLLVSETINIVVQINGKVRANIEVAAGSSEGDITKAAQADEKVAAHLGNQPAKKIVYVPGKLINFVV